MSKKTKRIINSYANGFAKSMDFNNKIRITKRSSSVSIHSAWSEIGLELTNVMRMYEKNHSVVSNAK